MIDHALKFLCAELNTYLVSRLNLNNTDEPVILANASLLNNSSEINAFMSLVNVEEESILKSQDNIAERNTAFNKTPKIFLNLYVLFAVTHHEYDEALKQLSLIIKFFRQQSIFQSNINLALNAAIDTLIVDMYALSIEQVSQLWKVFGGNYFPSVLYKIRLIGSEDAEI